MKNTILIACAILLTVSVPEFVSAQKYASLNASPADIEYFRPGGRNSVPVAKVIYSRPQKKGREMIGGKEPFGKIWRAGANESTEIKFYQDVVFGDKPIKAGTYTLYVIPNKEQWTIIINAKLDTWGAYGYDESKDVARIEVNVEKPSQEIEAFSIAFTGSEKDGKMYLAWENRQVVIPLKATGDLSNN